MSQLSKDHKAHVAYGLEVYEAAALEAWAVAAEGGEIPGVERIKKTELLAFFATISPGEWASEMARDPEGALGMLRNYIGASSEEAIADAVR